ncbi:MAG: PHP domain-containing protein [Patescibacteria group bacterium]
MSRGADAGRGSDGGAIRLFDLHTHTRASDGLLAPAELVAQAGTCLAGLAVTDHDTVAGLAEALAAGEEAGVPVVPGVELTTDHGPYEVHILAYFVDHGHEGLLAALGRVIEGRVARAKEIVARLARRGLPLPWAEVERQAPGVFIGRPHIMRALIARGMVHPAHADRFFRQNLAAGAPAFVPHMEMTTGEAIGLALAAGGVPVLAHPGRTGADHLLPELLAQGLQGIEARYPSHTPGETARYERLAREHDLVVTGGSDYHGNTDGPRLGQAAAPPANVAALAERAASRFGRAFLSALHVPGKKGE